MDEEDLFGLGMGNTQPAGIVAFSGKRQLDQESYSAWDYWAKITERPAREQPDRAFIKEYRRMRNLGFSHDSLIQNLSGASRVRPVGRDSMDTKRAIKAMTLEKAEIFAAAALDEGLPIITWEYVEKKQHLCTLSEIAKSLDMSIAEWNSSESDSAAIITQTITSGDLAKAVQYTEAISGKDWILPSDIVRWRRAWEKGQQIKAVANDKRDTYGAGTTEREKISKLLLTADKESERLLLLGCPYDAIEKFHNEAPEGYWETFNSQLEELIVLDEEDVSVDDLREDVVEALKGKYDWQPSDREIPEW